MVNCSLETSTNVPPRCATSNRPNNDTSTVDYTSTVVPIPTTTTEPHVATPIPTRMCESVRDLPSYTPVANPAYMWGNCSEMLMCMLNEAYTGDQTCLSYHKGRMESICC